MLPVAPSLPRKMKKSEPSLTRKMPQRTCVACRQVRPKRALLRVVRLAEGRVAVDATGRTAGRGAYLCGSRQCWEAGIKAGRLEHSLKTTLSPQNRDELIDFGRSLPEESLSGQAS